MTTKFLTAIVYLVLLIQANVPSASAASLLIKGARIIDGSGRPAFDGDVRVKDGKIVKIGQLKPSEGEEVLDATGLALAPGFIDIHNHSQSGLLREGAAANQVSQGITTVVVGPDGGSPFPLQGYFAKLDGKTAVNVASFIGHATLRARRPR